MIYFDNAATSYPKPKDVYRKTMEAMTEYGANPGRSGHKMAMRLNREIYATREKLRDLFNIERAEDIFFTSNGTESLNLGIKGIVREGDHIITTNIEHNSVLRLLYKLKDEGKVELSIIDGSKGYIDLGEIEKKRQENTSLLVVNHVSNVIGSIVNIEELGLWTEEHNLYFLVDAAQSAGVYDIDVKKMNIDILAFPGHKGLMGPQGTGGLYLRKDLDIEPLKYGGTGSLSESLLQPETLPDRYESGTLNGPGIVGLGAGIDWLKSVGIDKIRKKEEELTRYFIREVEKIEGIIIYGPKNKYQGPVVSINLKDIGSSEIAYILDEKYKIAVRSGLHCAPIVHKSIGTLEQGTLRFSFGYTNTYEEIDRALLALEELSNLY